MREHRRADHFSRASRPRCFTIPMASRPIPAIPSACASASWVFPTDRAFLATRTTTRSRITPTSICITIARRADSRHSSSNPTRTPACFAPSAPSHPGQSLLPIVVYREQLTNSLFPRVSGDIVQVTPLIERIPWRIDANQVVTIPDRLFAGFTEYHAPLYHYYFYVRDLQPVQLGAKYRYFVVRFNDQREIQEIIPAGDVELPLELNEISELQSTSWPRSSRLQAPTSELRRMLGASNLMFLWCLVLGAGCFSSRAAFVYETPTEFITSGDFDGDGRADALVLDKLTGNVRVGYQNANGALVWSAPRATGADGASALAVGRFAETNRESIAVTAADLNQIRVLNLSNPSNSPAPTIINPTHAGTSLLVGLDAPYGVTASRSWLTAGTHDPGITLLDLLAFAADGGSAAFQDQAVAPGISEQRAIRSRLEPIRPRSLPACCAAAMTPSRPIPMPARRNVLYRVGFAAGHRIHPGTFPVESGHQAVSVMLFYVPGQSNLIVQRIIASGSGLHFRRAGDLNLHLRHAAGLFCGRRHQWICRDPIRRWRRGAAGGHQRRLAS